MQTSSRVGGAESGGHVTTGPAGDAPPDLVLAEAQHRFANMFQLLASLVRRRQRRLIDAAAREQLEWVHDLTVMIGLLNRRLVAADQASVADMLAEQATLWRSICADQEVELVFDLDDVEVAACTAMPLALAAHELVINCFAHAFEGCERGTVWLALKRCGTHGELRVRDDGVGLPRERLAGASHAHGLALVARLAAQARGSFAIAGDAGTEAILRFPLGAQR